jgi:hypothetical protein
MVKSSQNRNKSSKEESSRNQGKLPKTQASCHVYHFRGTLKEAWDKGFSSGNFVARSNMQRATMVDFVCCHVGLMKHRATTIS